MQRSFHREATGAGVSAAPELFGNLGDIHPSLASQAYPEAAIGQFAEEDRNLSAAYRERVVDDPLAVFFNRPGPFHLLLRNPNPDERPLSLQRGKRGTQ